MSRDLAHLLEPFGVTTDSLVDLGLGPTPETIRYLDLLPRNVKELGPHAVVEVQNEPLAYIVDTTRSEVDPDLPSLRKKLALRGEGSYLALVEPGRLTLYDVALDHEAPKTEESLSAQDDRARTAFYRLHVDPEPDRRQRHYVHDILFRLLTDAVDGLQHFGVSRDDAISLTGRALFVRFLLDREILSDEDCRGFLPDPTNVDSLFSTPQATEATFRWLDQTFNGDFLPLSFWPAGSGFTSFQSGVFDLLSDIMYRSTGGQRRLDWGDLDFAHIPVGILSQVYEHQAERWDPSGQQARSVYYTPRRIAEFMIREVFAGLSEQGPTAPHEAKVLDPAVGGAVFLVAAFEEITAAWWRHHRRCPDTKELRSILYTQLTGFDIGEPALRLAALSLYLKSIELDLDPHPVERLRFKPLRNHVLYEVREASEKDAPYVLGSLGPRVDPSHRGKYDIVIGNPPWTSLRGQQGRQVHHEMVDRVRPVVSERLGAERASSFEIPDSVPDLVFVWRSMEWAKPSGWIAFALHGRLLFKTSTPGVRARKDLLDSITVTGILNGADLRRTQVWPRVTAPFALLFAKNECPPEDSAFHYASPYQEQGVNDRGRLRVDTKAAHPVALSRLQEQPYLLKVLFRGTSLDANVLSKVQANAKFQLDDYWDHWGLAHGVGYQVVEGGDDNDASELRGYPNLTTATDSFRFLVQASRLPSFNLATLHRPRDPQIYLKPLLLVRQSPKRDRKKGRALASFDQIAFSESFYGYSAQGHPDPYDLIKLLLILLHSDVFLWYILVTSSKFGIERSVMQKVDVDSLPVPALSEIGPTLRDRMTHIFQGLIDGLDIWSSLDEWVASVYGLDQWDLEVIRDTLAVASPFAVSQKLAQRKPSSSEVDRFVERLRSELQPAAKVMSESLEVRRLRSPEGSPWEILMIGGAHAHEIADPDMISLLSEADQAGASQVLLLQPRSQRLLIANLRQYRYWTPTRARLCAMEVLDRYFEDLLWSG